MEDNNPSESGDKDKDFAHAVVYKELLARDQQKTSEKNTSPESQKEPSAERAIEILESLKGNVSPEIFALLCHPNVVLTLAGARAQTEDFLDMPTQADKAGVVKLEQLLNDHDIVVQHEFGGDQSTEEAKYIGFSIMRFDVLDQAIANTKIPGIKPYDGPKTWEGLSVWVDACTKSLRKMQEEGKLDAKISSEDLEHIPIGVMKGYPDKAMLSYFALPKEVRLSDQVTDSNIPYADFYVCPQPNYDYATQYKDDPEISQHRAGWAQILTDFYESGWHRELQKEPEFVEALANLKQRREISMPS